MCAKRMRYCNVCRGIYVLVAGCCWWNTTLMWAIPGCPIRFPTRAGAGWRVAMVSRRHSCWRRCPAVFCARCMPLQAWQLIEHCDNLADRFDVFLNFIAIFGVGGQFEVGGQIVQGVRVVFQLEMEDAAITSLNEKVWRK